MIQNRAVANWHAKPRGNFPYPLKFLCEGAQIIYRFRVKRRLSDFHVVNKSFGS